jgi:putative spermidine/putrescine transport system substrate-binding protein
VNKVSRQMRLSTVVASCLMLLATSACSSGDSNGGEESVVFNTTGGEFSETLNEVVSVPFSEESGIKVVSVAPNNEAKVRLMVEKNRVEWDVVHTDPTFAIKYCDEFTEPLDFDIIDTSGLPDELVSECAVPLIRPAFLLVYNTDKYGDNPPTGWKDFFDLEQYPGTRGMFNSAADSGALEAAMVSAGTTLDHAGEIDLDAAFDQLDRIKSEVTFFATGSEMQEALGSKRVDMGIAWLGRAYSAVEAGAPYKPVWNEAIHYYDALMVVKGAPHKDAAMKFINHAVSANVQAKISEKTTYPAANDEAKPVMSKNQDLFSPPADAAAVARNYDWWIDNLDEATTRWTDWSTG